MLLPRAAASCAIRPGRLWRAVKLLTMKRIFRRALPRILRAMRTNCIPVIQIDMSILARGQLLPIVVPRISQIQALTRFEFEVPGDSADTVEVLPPGRPVVKVP